MKWIVATLVAWTIGSSALAQEVPAAKGLDAAAKASLTERIAAAVKEGSLTYADTIIQPNTSNALVEAFRARYGLPQSFRVNFTLLGSAALVTRLEQEIGAKRVTFDVAAVASPIWAFDAYRRGYFLEYHSTEYAAYKAAFNAGLGVDGNFIFNGAYAQIPIWNSDVLTFNGTTYKDVLSAAVPGRFSIGDAAQSESQLTTYVGLRQIYDVDFFNAVAAKKPAFIYRSELSAQRVLTGQDVIAMGGGAARVMQANMKGAKLKVLYPKEGFTLLPQSMFILKAAPHPNAAKLWLDFILSEQGQDILCRREALISGRAGYKSPISDIAPDIGSLKVIPVNWSTMDSATLAKYRQEWNSIFNP